MSWKEKLIHTLAKWLGVRVYSEDQYREIVQQNLKYKRATEIRYFYGIKLDDVTKAIDSKPNMV